MTKANIKTKKGFTIIEVVLVLAIAGLIFLMVFVALPALQRSQRDTQRRDDMARLITAVQNYQTNHKNKVPSSYIVSADGTNAFIDGYLKTNGDTFDDPSTGSTYVFKDVKCEAGDKGCPNASLTGEGTNMGNIMVYKHARCNEDGVPEYVSTGGDNMVAFTIKLEGADTYCVNN